MKIVFYSTSASAYEPGSIEILSYPGTESRWRRLAELFPEHDFAFAAQNPPPLLGGFDFDRAGADSPSNLKFVALNSTGFKDLAEEILRLEPELAICATAWNPPFDWLPVQDALVGQILRGRGVRTLCHGADAAEACLEKFQTRKFFEQAGFCVPDAVLVSRELLFCERRFRSITRNVYRDYVFSRIRQMRFPVVIKDAAGLSSYSMEVARTFGEAAAYLNSGRTSGDRIVEEYVEGEHLGAELYSAEGKAHVLPPMLFSLNKYGITSPKQSVKMGPVKSASYDLAGLGERLASLARIMGFCGAAQVDLVFSGGKWFAIEANPRLSGMTETYAAMLGSSPQKMLLDCALGRGEGLLLPEGKFWCNFKLPIVSAEQFGSISQLGFVRYARQVHNKAARQEREKGFCEIVFGGADSGAALMEMLRELAGRFPQLIEPAFFDKAQILSEKL